MDSLGNEFLPRARFAEDEDGRICRGNPLRLLERCSQRRTAAHEFAEKSLVPMVDAKKSFFDERLDGCHGCHDFPSPSQWNNSGITILEAKRDSFNRVIP